MLKVIARSTPGFSGADLANLVNEAALVGARNGQDKVTMKDLEFAKDKVLMGVERKSMIISDEEKKNTAYHEAGHALMAALIPEADPIHKVTIIPRGMALGLTQQLPLDDRYTYTKDYLEAQLSVLLAGRVAEMIFLGKTTTGAANDFEKATEIARKMVCQWGMSDLGPLTFGERDDLIFLGRDLAVNKNFSERTSERIDDEVKKIVLRNYSRTQELIEKNKDKLIKIAEALLDKEVLSSDEINQIVDGKMKPEAKKGPEKGPPPRRSRPAARPRRSRSPTLLKDEGEEDLRPGSKGRRYVLGRKTWIMGILNVTPDSFSDGGSFRGPEEAVARGAEMIGEGADVIDVGGESTRPGARPVPEDEELDRVVPVIRALRERTDALISVDTTKAAVARAALDAGADIVNDVSALRFDPRMAGGRRRERGPGRPDAHEGDPGDHAVPPGLRGPLRGDLGLPGGADRSRPRGRDPGGEDHRRSRGSGSARRPKTISP